MNQLARNGGYAPLHWAASTEHTNTALVQVLLHAGADPNLGGGENVDALMGIVQTPAMLAGQRGAAPILALLLASGATNKPIDHPLPNQTSVRRLAAIDSAAIRQAVERALPPIQETSLASREAYLRHASRQDCTSCHQQYLPLAAIGAGRKLGVKFDAEAERKLISMIMDVDRPPSGDLPDMERDVERDWLPLFHPDAAQTKGHALLGFATANLPATPLIDAFVHQLAVIQGKDGRWHNNMPRPPIQSSDVGATALAIHGLQRYPLPGRRAEFSHRVARARDWLWSVKPDNHEQRVFQLLGLAWSGVSPARLQPLAKALLAEQRHDGGWSQLSALESDAFATGQAIYALRVSVGLPVSDLPMKQGICFLLENQLEDGTWHVRRRTFPFQPTMKSGFPHGRDSWISAAGSSWAVMALSVAARANGSPGGASRKKSLARHQPLELIYVRMLIRFGCSRRTVE